jgi:8-oxo-dGTP pyrophosphatase MutT (NUDIX family)
MAANELVGSPRESENEWLKGGFKMRLIAQIGKRKPGMSYRFRRAARIILFDGRDRIALLFLSRRDYHKLPGGGVEPKESLVAALKRELKEEVGTRAIVKGEIGKIIEYRLDLWHHSYCYFGDVSGRIGRPEYTDLEKELGFKLKWVKLDDAIGLLERDKPKGTIPNFIRRRDLIFLRKAKEILGR